MKTIEKILLNAKWIMFVILLLNISVFGYGRKFMESRLCAEEEFWGTIIVVALFLFFVFDRFWKKLINKIFDSISG